MSRWITTVEAEQLAQPLVLDSERGDLIQRGPEPPLGSYQRDAQPDNRSTQDTWCQQSRYQVSSRVVSGIQEYTVSASGQMSLPANARHRWNLDGGGPVDVIDLGFGVLTVPKGQGSRLLDDLLSADQHAEFVRSLADDPDLATT